MQANAMVRAVMLAWTVLALVGFCIPAKAQPICPELSRLRSEAQQALRKSRTVAAPERCYMYNRLSEAWRAVAQYANDNREACHIAIASLDELERYHEEAIKDRDNVCAGRPLRPYRADIIQH